MMTLQLAGDTESNGPCIQPVTRLTANSRRFNPVPYVEIEPNTFASAAPAG
jgi:hypothetical protein